MNYISLKDCVPRWIYKLDSRNLAIGVYDGDNGFIGIRTKFGDRYLFIEYHWDYGGDYATVKPLEKIGELPEEIECNEHDALYCDKCLKRGLEFRLDDPKAAVGRGKWYHFDGTPLCEGGNPEYCRNGELFIYLEKLEAGL